MAFVDHDRIVTPADRTRTDDHGELPECVRDLLPYGHIRLDVPAVRSDRDIPELSVRREKLHMRKHGRGILGTEGDDVDDRGIETVARDLLCIIWVAYAHLARMQAIDEPRCIERRNIRTHTRMQNHDAPPFFP